MLIRYSRKRLLPNLIFGCIFIAIGLLMVSKAPTNILRYGYFLMGSLYLGIWIFERTYQYLLISDGVLTKNSIKPRSMPLTEVDRIVKSSEDITLYSQKERLRINTELIDQRSLEDLERVLDNLEITPDNDPVQMTS